MMGLCVVPLRYASGIIYGLTEAEVKVVEGITCPSRVLSDEVNPPITTTRPMANEEQRTILRQGAKSKID